jgi:hypothetical protein
VKLHNARLTKKSKVNGEMAYEKDDFLSSKLRLILKLADDPRALAEFPTKNNPKSSSLSVIHVSFPAPKSMVDTKVVRIDDTDTFHKVKDLPLGPKPKLVPIGENWFQAGLQTILQEDGTFNDWG